VPSSLMREGAAAGASDSTVAGALQWQVREDEGGDDGDHGGGGGGDGEGKDEVSIDLHFYLGGEVRATLTG